MKKNTNITLKLEAVPVADLRPSKTNPRKHFSETSLRELADSITAQGIRQPILARPSAGDTPFEIVAGERRYRAAKMAGLDVVPCILSSMADNEAIEVQVVENLQRSDLTEMEEAESYQAMLDLRGDDGAACYTVSLLSKRFGISESKIYQRLKLLALPEAGRKALADGILGARQLVLIGRIPDPEERARALEKVLHPKYSNTPLTYKETEELISEEFMQGLKGAPFRLDDAKLLPAAGACSTCTKMTDNCRHLFSPEEAAQFAKRKVCTDPACFRLKLAAVWAKRVEQAEREGQTVLSEAESRKVFSEGGNAGFINYESPYVLLSDKPKSWLLKPEVVEAVGTWRSLLDQAEQATAERAFELEREKIEGDASLDKKERTAALARLKKNPPVGCLVPRVLARDQAGRARELVDSDLARAAIEQAGEPIFRESPRGIGRTSDDFVKARKAEMEAAKIRTAESIEGMRQMHAALVSIWMPSPIWEAILPVAMNHAGSDGLWLVGKWQGLKFGVHGAGKRESIETWAKGLQAAERQALVPLLLLGSQMKFSGLTSDFEAVAKEAGLGVRVEKVRRAVKAQMKAAKTGKKEPKLPGKKSEALDAARGTLYEWNACGVAEKPDIEEPMGKMPKGASCKVLLALAPDGKWRYALEAESRMPGKQRRSALPSLDGPGFGGASGWDDALIAAFTAALPFFRDDPDAFRVVAEEADEEAVAAFEKKQKYAEWAKAFALGMPIAEIARSYGTTEEDVAGALEVDRSAPPAAQPVALAYEFVAGDLVEWQVGPGKTGRGFIVTIDEYQRETGLQWNKEWNGIKRAVRCPQGKSLDTRWYVIDDTTLHLVEKAKKEVA